MNAGENVITATRKSLLGELIVDAVLVNPCVSGVGLNNATIEPPLGLAYIAATLEQRHFRCRIIDANALRLSVSQVMDGIPQDTRLIGLHVNAFSYRTTELLARECRKRFSNAVLVIGGPSASAIPDQILRCMPCDGVIKGEGEYALVAVLENLKAGLPPFDSTVPGAVFRSSENSEITSNPAVRIRQLDDMPLPSYHLLPDLRFYRSRARKRPVAGIITSRGCPYACIFCSKDVFQRHVVFRSPDSVLREIDYLVSHMGVRQIDILDDNFTCDRSRVEAILEGLIERKLDLAINLQTGIRVENTDDSLLAKMKNAGVYKLGFGIESADPSVLEVCRKHLDLERAAAVIRSAKAMGFIIHGFFIIGLPTETEDSFQNTLEFARRMDFDVANFTLAIPFVGTELYQMVHTGGRFLIETTHHVDAGFYGGQPFYELGGVTGEAVARRYRAAYREFYSIHKRLRMLASIRSWSEAVWLLRTSFAVLRGLHRNVIAN